MNIAAGTTLVSGALNAAEGGDPAGSGTLARNQIAQAGSVTIASNSSGGLTVGDGAQIFSSGANTSISSVGNLTLGSVVSMRANGGNLLLLTRGTIAQTAQGASSHTFVARAVGTSTSSTGGSLELGSGTLSSYMSTASGKPQGVTQATGGNENGRLFKAPAI